MRAAELWSTGMMALGATETYDPEAQPREHRLSRIVALVCLGGAVASALQTVWEVAERTGRRRALTLSTLDHVLRQSGQAERAAEAAYYGAWADASGYYGGPPPDYVTTAARRAGWPDGILGEDPGEELGDAPAPDA